MYPFLVIQLEMLLCCSVDKFNRDVLQSHTETKLKDIQ